MKPTYKEFADWAAGNNWLYLSNTFPEAKVTEARWVSPSGIILRVLYQTADHVIVRLMKENDDYR